jgi:hypothetical protein
LAKCYGVTESTAPLVQNWLHWPDRKHRPSRPEVTGSSPAGRANVFTQWVAGIRNQRLDATVDDSVDVVSSMICDLKRNEGPEEFPKLKIPFEIPELREVSTKNL